LGDFTTESRGERRGARGEREITNCDFRGTIGGEAGRRGTLGTRGKEEDVGEGETGQTASGLWLRVEVEDEWGRYGIRYLNLNLGLNCGAIAPFGTLDLGIPSVGGYLAMADIPGSPSGSFSFPPSLPPPPIHFHDHCVEPPSFARQSLPNGQCFGPPAEHGQIAAFCCARERADNHAPT
jgi:hypothetical protein